MPSASVQQITKEGMPRILVAIIVVIPHFHLRLQHLVRFAPYLKRMPAWVDLKQTRASLFSLEEVNWANSSALPSDSGMVQVAFDHPSRCHYEI